MARLFNIPVEERRRNRPLATAITVALLVLYAGLGIFGHTLTSGGGDGISKARSGLEIFLSHSVRQQTRSHNGYDPGFCTGDKPTNVLKSSNRLWLLLLLPFVVLTFVASAVVTDDYFCPALEDICVALKLSDDVAGATFMAVGSSAPELFTSLIAVLVTKSDIGLGTIVGSDIVNLCVIIGICCCVAGAQGGQKLDWRPLARDYAFYITSVVGLLSVIQFSSRGQITTVESGIGLGFYVLFVMFLSLVNKKYMEWTSRFGDFEDVQQRQQQEEGKDSEKDYSIATPSTSYGTDTTATTEAQQSTDSITKLKKQADVENGLGEGEINTDVGRKSPIVSTLKYVFIPERPHSILGWCLLPFAYICQVPFRMTVPECSEKKRWEILGKWSVPKWPFTFTISVLWICVISYGMVVAATLAGCFMSIPSAVMGLTVLAAGTSVPDMLASVAAVRDGKTNMAVGNAVGSNIFNILIGAGLPYFIESFRTGTGSVKVSSGGIREVVVPITILLGIIFSIAVGLIVSKWILGRKLGIFLFILYGLFAVWTLIDVFALPEERTS